jgi:phage-related minor tail protein
LASLAEIFVNIGADISDFQKAMGKMEESLRSVGDKMKEIGEGITTVAAPLIGLGAVGLSAAADMEKGNGKMQAALGLTADEAEKLGNVSKAMWKDAFGGSIEEVNDALITTSQNIQGLNEADLQKVTEAAFVLRDTFGAEINETTRAASVLMKNFGIDGSKAMDLMTLGFQQGGNYSDELLDTLREYSPQFAKMGHSAEDMLGILLAGTDAGAWNLDKVGDAVKEFNIRAKDGSKLTAEGFAAIGLSAADMGSAIAEGGEKGQAAFQATIAGLAGMEDEVARNAAGVALFGTQWEDLEADVVSAMVDGIGSIGPGVEGATKRAGDALYNNIGNRATEAWREFQDALVPAGMVLMDLVDRILPPLVSGIQAAASWFDALGPTIQTVIVVVGTIMAALGPFLLILGQIISAVSALMPVFSAVGGIIAGVASIGVWPLIAAVGALIGIGVLLYKNWEEISAWAVKTWGAIMAFIQPAVDAVSSFIMSKFGEVKAFWMEVWPMLSQAFQNIWNGIVAFLTPIINGIVAVFKWAWPAIQLIIVGTWEAIKNVINGALDIIMGVIKAFAALFTGNWSALWESIKQIIGGALELIWGWVQLFGVGRLLKLFGSLGTKLLNIIVDMWNKIKYEFDFKMLQISDGVTGVFNKIVDFVMGLGRTFYNAGKGLIDQMKEGIENAAQSVINSVKNIAQKVRDFLPFSPAKTGPLSDLDKLDFGGPISDSLTSAIPAVTSLMNDLMRLPAITVGSDLNAANLATQGATNDTYNVNVQLNASDLSEMQNVYEFFNTFRQVKRARG